MRQTANYSARSTVNFLLCLLAILSVNLGCINVRRPWRDYSDKPFNSQEWLAGDAIERGRMYGDIYKSRVLEGKSREDVVRHLGEPNKKATVEGREVWLYRIINRFHNRLNQFPVTFEGRKGATAVGMKSGTASTIVDEEWANEK